MLEETGHPAGPTEDPDHLVEHVAAEVVHHTTFVVRQTFTSGEDAFGVLLWNPCRHVRPDLEDVPEKT